LPKLFLPEGMGSVDKTCGNSAGFGVWDYGAQKNGHSGEEGGLA